MRIDRRGNPAFRRFPDAEELKANVDLTGSAGLGEQRSSLAKDRPSAPSDAFGVLENRHSGFLAGIASVFAAVGQALRDIKQGSSKTFD